MTLFRFRSIIRNYYKKHKRDMPWRETWDPYRILVSEIMLQQTQVSRVMDFYPRLLKKFPAFRSLADAEIGELLKVWQGLGYNRRALNLRKLSRIVLEKFNGRLPRQRIDLESLPGIGKATAGSLRAFAFNEPDVFIETNIRRVFIHFFFPKRKKVTDRELERYIKSTLDRKNPREWYWALMDYGAELRSSRVALKNPNQKSAHYKKQPRFPGSNRELRGKILRAVLREKSISLPLLAREAEAPLAQTKTIADVLLQEGFLKKSGGIVSLASEIKKPGS